MSSGSASSTYMTTFRPTRLIAALFALHVISCVAAVTAGTDSSSRRTPRRRRDNRDRDILEELAYVNPLSGRPRSLTAGGRYSTRLPDQHAHNHHNHHHDQRTRFHPHHAYDDQLSQSHPHHQNPHKATEMTMHYVSPKDTSRITKNTLLRDHVLHSPTKTPSARMQMGSRVLPRHRPRGSPGGPRRRTVSEKSKTGSANGGIASGATGGKGVQRRHTL